MSLVGIPPGKDMNNIVFALKPSSHTRTFKFAILAVLIVLSLSVNFYIIDWGKTVGPISYVPHNSAKILSRCKALDMRPGPPPSFSSRTQSDRFQQGTKPALIRNATIWTGPGDVINGDIFIDGGIVRHIGVVPLSALSEDVVIVDVEGSWVTPGVVDLHSHISVESLPGLEGADDGNSFHGPVLPWLRAVDGMNTHDESFPLSVAGGVTTSLILPGSANAIGGQGFVMKLRPTEERSTMAMLLEPPFGLNSSEIDYSLPTRWRHVKHACGENPARVYSATRMDTVWSMREAYDKAIHIKQSQDEYCSKAVTGQWSSLGNFPEELQWEALVDVLRGKVKVQTHCYEAVDIDRFMSISNEFKFPIAAFHHAHEAYLVPDVLKKGFEPPPAAAMFATFSRYKREAYRHSVYAPRVLADSGIKVVMKSDAPAINPRFLIHEARLAHHYGLDAETALASVISTPAEVLGLDHRVGYLRKGYDADLVIWDAHPLNLGATPKQVYIDGIPQLSTPIILARSPGAQIPYSPPDFTDERQDTILYEGLPPLEIQERSTDTVIFTNVSTTFRRSEWSIAETSTPDHSYSVVVQNGQIVCSSGADHGCQNYISETTIAMDLKGGSIGPALVSVDTAIGLQHISGEASTTDGTVTDPLTMHVPGILQGTIVKASDGLQFSSIDALMAYREGVSSAITAPQTVGFISGMSVSFTLGSKNKLQKGAVLQNVVALHVKLTRLGVPSVSTQIAVLRKLLLHSDETGLEQQFKRASEGNVTLAIGVNSADIMATLLQLKAEVEETTSQKMKMAFIGGAEAHLLAHEISEANVGVILSQPRSYPNTWEERRILPGPPLSPSPISVLFSQGVSLGISSQGIQGVSDMSNWSVHTLRFDAGWAAITSGGNLTKSDAFAIASSNIERILGVDVEHVNTDLAVTLGGDLLSMESKVVAMISPRRGTVDFF